MNFQESVIGIASRFEQQRDLLRTEEATKNAVVMPMTCLVTCWSSISMKYVNPPHSSDAKGMPYPVRVPKK